MGEPNVCGFKIGDRVYWMIGEMHGVGNLDRGTVVDLHIDREMLVVVWDDDNYADPRSI